MCVFQGDSRRKHGKTLSIAEARPRGVPTPAIPFELQIPADMKIPAEKVLVKYTTSRFCTTVPPA